MKESNILLGLQYLENEFGKEKIERAIENVSNFKVEIPSWIFGDFGGGRFGEYIPPGCARNIYEKLNDAAFVSKITGAIEAVAVETDDGLYRARRFVEVTIGGCGA